MDSQSILIPVYRGTLLAKIEKGTHWSVVEHLILFALTEQPRTLSELATYSRLHLSVTTEAAIRLLRVGWLELIEGQDAVRFRASGTGAEEAKKEELTPIVSTISRKLHYVIDRTTGDLFGINGLSLRRAREAGDGPPNARRLPAVLAEGELPGYVELMDRLSLVPGMIAKDEKITGCDIDQSGLSSDWYLAVIASGSEILGLSQSHSPRLFDYVRAASAAWEIKNSGVASAAPPTPTRSPMFAERRTHLSPEDLIAGGPAHRDILRRVISSATEVVILHSTFLAKDRLEDLIGILKKAAKRRVKVHMLWDCGHSPSDIGTLESCRHLINVSGLSGWVRIHAVPTHSHAKVLIADDGVGGYLAIVGSCNWLSSPFKSFEVSVRLCEPALVSDCLAFLERAIPVSWHDTEMRQVLIPLSLKLKRHRGSSVGDDRVRLLTQGDHDAAIGLAVSQANSRIFVASNKAGNAIENQVLAPLEGASLRDSMHINLYYQNERKESALTPLVRQNLKKRYPGIAIDTRESRHAKLLCWDRSHAVVTSLNWLSKDASDSKPMGECGLYIESAGIADRIIQLYLEHRPRRTSDA